MPHPRGSLLPLAFAIGLLAGITAALLALRRLDAVEVTGSSMRPGLVPGDRLLVESWSYAARDPRAGEIVLAPDPRGAERELVKRVGAIHAGAWTAELSGDAPEASTDSRTFGPVPLSAIRWRVVARYWPPSRAGRVG